MKKPIILLLLVILINPIFAFSVSPAKQTINIHPDGGLIEFYIFNNENFTKTAKISILEGGEYTTLDKALIEIPKGYKIVNIYINPNSPEFEYNLRIRVEEYGSSSDNIRVSTPVEANLKIHYTKEGTFSCKDTGCSEDFKCVNGVCIENSLLEKYGLYIIGILILIIFLIIYYISREKKEVSKNVEESEEREW